MVRRPVGRSDPGRRARRRAGPPPPGRAGPARSTGARRPPGDRLRRQRASPAGSYRSRQRYRPPCQAGKAVALAVDRMDTGRTTPASSSCPLPGRLPARPLHGDLVLVGPDESAHNFHKLKSIIQSMDRASAPPLLPIMRSQQQGDILALVLGDPEREMSLTEISRLTGAPQPSVHREVQRAEQTGLVTSRKIGNTRLVRANIDSPYYAGLADVLTRAFGVPAVLTRALTSVRGIDSAYVYGSWAARHAGQSGERPVGDIDLLVLGQPDRDELYSALAEAEDRLGRPVQATIREADWLESGSGSFHDTVTSRPMVRLTLADS